MEVRAVEIKKGLKIFCEGKKHCLQLEQELNDRGFVTRSGCNEARMWSVYIVDTPIDSGFNLQID